MVKLIAILLFCQFLAIAVPKAHGRTVQEVTGNVETKWYQDLGQAKLKVTKIHFYVQDVLSGENATVWNVAQAAITQTSPTRFGLVTVFDDLLTVGPEPNSGDVGRIQGIIALNDLNDIVIQMVVTIVFTTGEYNGSTLSILGRNPFLRDVREVPIVGGTGAFQLARGSAKITTYSTNSTYGVLEYHITVAYYEFEGKSVFL